MKILNLDKLNTAAVKRQLVVGGVSYPIEDMTVANFIATTKAAEEIADAPISKQIEATVEMVLRSVPTIDREFLGKQSLETLKSIVAFVRGDDVEGAESVQAEGEGAEAKK